MADDESDADVSAGSGGAMSRLQEHRKEIGVAVFLVVVVAAAGVLYTQGAFSGLQAPTQPGQDTGDDTGDTGTTGDQNDSFNTYASADEDSASTETEGTTFMGTVEIQQYGTSPARIEGKVGEAVRFDNTNSFPVTVTFDRSDTVLNIPANGEDSAKFRAITQYTATNADTGDEIGSGTIYVE